MTGKPSTEYGAGSRMEEIQNRSTTKSRSAGTLVPPRADSAFVMALRPTNGLGLAHTVLAVLVTSLGLALSMTGIRVLWFVGQVVFALGFVKWFTLLHEAGHRTLFASRAANTLVGRMASVIAIVPYSSWKAIHRMHHKWAGWQDKDPTTSSLVPRKLGGFERIVIQLAWFLWLPLFSVLYRVQSFWHLPRLFRLFDDSSARRAFVVDIFGLLTFYGMCLAIVGPKNLLGFVGLGYLIGFAWMDVIMLSQHTHIPLKLAQGADVKPIPAPEQAPYTRSLLFSPWLSIGILSGFDAHELHHVFPFVPGPRLREIPWIPPNEVPGWAWTRQAKAVPADVFLFQNRNTSGLSI